MRKQSSSILKDTCKHFVHGFLKSQ